MFKPVLMQNDILMAKTDALSMAGLLCTRERISLQKIEDFMRDVRGLATTYAGVEQLVMLVRQFLQSLARRTTSRYACLADDTKKGVAIDDMILEGKFTLTKPASEALQCAAVSARNFIHWSVQTFVGPNGYFIVIGIPIR